MKDVNLNLQTIVTIKIQGIKKSSRNLNSLPVQQTEICDPKQEKVLSGMEEVIMLYGTKNDVINFRNKKSFTIYMRRS